jgi:DNA modification methylase
MNIIEFGDCRETMRRWADDGVKAQMCVTSPPYFGLRDYGHEGQIGLEQTPEEYIAAMVEVFRCVRDVLADDGTVWLNIGDSYAGSWGNAGGHNRGNGTQRAITVGSVVKDQAERNGNFVPPGARGYKDQGIKPKDLIGIPWMLAFALRADGWYLRQDIIWHKPNPMPESVTDRCTKSHEYIFLLSKSERYYFDAEAMKEPAVSGAIGAAASFKRTGSKREQTIPNQGYGTHRPERENIAYNETRNRRSVWSVATKPYEGAHFATYPEELIEPCIMAGSRVGDIVLDPFMGSGTTAQVAQDLGRQYIGCELNPAYKALQDRRTQQQSLVLA